MVLPSPDYNRTCVVTGASSGIGADIARELARRGRGVTLVARREDRLKALACDLAASHNIRAEVIGADLSDESARGGIADEVARRGLTVDVLVNNAGFSTPRGPVRRSDQAREIAMIRVNVEAVVDLCSRFLPGMVERGTGAILNVASIAAFQAVPGKAGYSASKAFVLTYTRAIWAELRGTGVTATVLCPGPVETEFAETSGVSLENDVQLPKFLWVSSPDVAKAGVDGMVKGRAMVIPGAGNKVTAITGCLSPPTLLLPLIARKYPSLRE